MIKVIGNVIGRDEDSSATNNMMRKIFILSAYLLPPLVPIPAYPTGWIKS